ncbi:hypothetical protein [Paenibacillus aceris]|uniref:Uncharacterized protein n=1 Tax=Paenibacillus aceris TaxID=869555 RepID=A0ABS4I9U5_9BACL|nr:hypothetical protein [Paenibacillus aceris]
MIIDAGLASETKCLRRANGKVKVKERSFYRNEEDDRQCFSHRSTGHGGSDPDCFLTSNRTSGIGRAVWMGDLDPSDQLL